MNDMSLVRQCTHVMKQCVYKLLIHIIASQLFCMTISICAPVYICQVTSPVPSLFHESAYQVLEQWWNPFIILQIISQTLQVIIPSFQFTDFGCIRAIYLAGTCGGGEPGVPPRLCGEHQEGVGSALQPTSQQPQQLVTYATRLTTSVAVNETIPFSSGDVLGFTPGSDYSGFYFQIAS